MSRWTTEALWLGHPGDDGDPDDEALRRFEAWCAAHPGARVTVWLGSALMTPLLVGPDLPLRDDAALRAWAQRVFAHYGVAASAPLATWRSGPRLGAVALEGIDLPALQAAAARHRVRLAALRPGWALALHTLCRREPALARGRRRAWLREPGLLTALQIEDGRLTGIEPCWTAGGAGDAAPAAGEPVFDAPLNGCPATGPSAPDFLAAPVRREGLAGWALAATGAVVLGVALADAGWVGVGGVGGAGPVAASLPLAGAADAAGGGAPGDPLAAATWAARAGHPWADVFSAGEQASVPGVQWLHFEHDAARQDVRLAGVVPDMALALAAAERLAAASGVRQALLAQADAAAAGDGVRFELQAQFQGAGSTAETTR